MTPEHGIAEPKARGKAAQASENIVDLLGKLARQGSHLAQEQLNLVQAEMRETAVDVKQAIAASLGAVIFGVAGLGVLLMGLSYLLGDAIDDPALATIIVGGVTLLISGIFYLGAKKKLSENSLRPQRSIETIASTPDAVTGQLTENGTKDDR